MITKYTYNSSFCTFLCYFNYNHSLLYNVPMLCVIQKETSVIVKKGRLSFYATPFIRLELHDVNTGTISVRLKDLSL